ncbi:hypothetical protein GOB36_30950 [Sinorhizobium meliloti]|nr:hypothetical protein [Sinorhizobium meliloti]MDX0036145.1 hypothetical protein [Sinorhizobium meliloti]
MPFIRSALHTTTRRALDRYLATRLKAASHQLGRTGAGHADDMSLCRDL